MKNPKLEIGDLIANRYGEPLLIIGSEQIGQWTLMAVSTGHTFQAPWTIVRDGWTLLSKPQKGK